MPPTTAPVPPTTAPVPPPAAFEPFSLTHAAIVIGFAAAMVVLVFLRRRSSPAAGVRLDRVLALAAGATFLASNLWQLLPAQYVPAQVLPLHICDLALVAATLALGLDWRPARAILYFWGLGLSSQGFLTPDLRDGPADLGFWFFWFSHGFVVGGGVYDLAARRFRPTWRDLRVVVVVSLVYLAVVFCFDSVTGYNYGYVGPSAPGQPSIIDALGPYPGRVIVMALLALGAMVLLQCVVVVLAGRTARRHPA